MQLFFWRQPGETAESTASDAVRDWLSEDEWQAAVQQIAKRPIDFNGPERRSKDTPRHAVIRRCLLRVERRGEVLGMLLVRSRNLSSTGMCVLHGGRVPRHSKATVIIEADGQAGVTTGTIIWCKRAKGVAARAVHEIGVQFDAQIDVSAFVGAEERTLDQDMRVA